MVERLRVEVVAHEDGGVVAPLRVRRRPPAPERRLVDDVVVDERRRVEELDDAGEAHAPRRRVAPPGAPRAAAGSDAGACRRRPRCTPPISWMRATGRVELARGSRPRPPRGPRRRAPATRSFRTRSRVGVATRPRYFGTTRSLIWIRGAGRDALHLRDREPVADLGDARVADLLVELAEHLAGDGMHDRDRVAPEAHEASRAGCRRRR